MDQPLYSKKATKNLISSWIRNLIREAYEWTAGDRESLRASSNSSGSSTDSSASHLTNHVRSAPRREVSSPPDGRTGRMSLVSRRNAEHEESAGPGLGVLSCRIARHRVCPRNSASDRSTSSPDLSRPAHELRAIAASLAYLRGARLQDLMSAVGWQTHSTWGRIYLRQLPFK